MPFSTLRRVAAFSGILFLPDSGAAHATTELAGFVPFAPESIWNLPLADDAALASIRAGQISLLTHGVATSGAQLNTTFCGMPEHRAEATMQAVPVELNHPSHTHPALTRPWCAALSPADVQPANCSDQNFSLLQRPNGNIKEWWFWKATHNTDGSWTAGLG